MRIDYGPGYRVYYKKVGQKIVVLLVGGGMVFENFDTPGSFDFDKSFGLSARLGYQFNEQLALDLEYLHLDGFATSYNGVEVFDTDGYAVTVNARFFMSDTQAKPYFLAGMGIADFKVTDTIGYGFSVSDSDILIKAGLGIDYKVSDSVALFGEISYCYTEGNIEGMDYIPLIVGVKFKL